MTKEIVLDKEMGLSLEILYDKNGEIDDYAVKEKGSKIERDMIEFDPDCYGGTINECHDLIVALQYPWIIMVRVVHDGKEVKEVKHKLVNILDFFDRELPPN